MAYWIEVVDRGETVLYDLDKAIRIEMYAGGKGGNINFANAAPGGSVFDFSIEIVGKRAYELIVEYVKSLEVKR